MIAAAYIRVSTDDQTEYSPDSQRKRILEYASSHNMTIPEHYIYVDEGISGRSVDKRPAFQTMIATAKTKCAFQKILVWKFSRFARNRQDSILYKTMLRKECGIEVISVSEPLTDDPTSILIEALLEAMDEFYSINLSQEVRRGMDERFSRGKPISVAPFGYQMLNGELHIFKPQAHWVQYIYEAYSTGHSYKAIADMLNASHVKTTRNRPFESRAIAYILHNPIYCGMLRKKDAIIRGIHEPIISDDLWLSCQASHHVASSTSSYIPNKYSSLSNDNNYYLKNLIYCHTCGHVLIQINHGTAFQCSGYHHQKCHCSHYIKRTKLEAMINKLCEEELSPLSYVKYEKMYQELLSRSFSLSKSNEDHDSNYNIKHDLNTILSISFGAFLYDSNQKKIVPTIRRS